MVEKLVGLVLVSSRGDLILDPFAGTFSTCVPAVMMDREAGGVEMGRSIWAGALRFRKGWGNRKVLRRHIVRCPRIGQLLRPPSIDAVVISPPYALTSLHAGDPERRVERVRGPEGVPTEFFGDLSLVNRLNR